MSKRGFVLSFLVLTSLAPSTVSAAESIQSDARITPKRTSHGVRPTFSGLLDAPEGEAFFEPPTPLPGVPGDVIWAMRSPTPCEDLYGALRGPGTCDARLPRMLPSSREVQIWRIMFHSLDRSGRSRAVSAIVVADPPTASTARILVTQHGSYGNGDQCGIIGNPFGGGFVGLGMTAENYAKEGWVVIAPSAPGAKSPGVQTSLISGDSSRSIIDAAWAAHVFTGATPEAVIHGHSIGGMMVTAVGGEVSSYAPQLTIKGVIANAPAGLSGPSSPLFDSTRGPLIDKAFDVRAAGTKNAALALAAAYEQAFAPNFKSADYLTAAGQRAWLAVKDLCVEKAAQYLVGLSWKKLFKKPLPALDSGTMQRLSGVPTWIVISTIDTFADPLNVYHAYQTLCAAGQPTYLSTVEVDHIGTLGVLSSRDTTGLKTWVNSVAQGEIPEGSCTGMSPSLASWQLYTFNQVARALSMNVPAKSKLSMRASGNCKIVRQVLSVTSGGSCTLTISVLRGKRVVESRSQTFKTVA